MIILVNILLRDGYHLHCLAEDAKTPISGRVRAPDQDTLEKMLRYVGATEDAITEAQNDLRRWSATSVWLTLAPGRKNLLRIVPSLAKGLGLW